MESLKATLFAFAPVPIVSAFPLGHVHEGCQLI